MRKQCKGKNNRNSGKYNTKHWFTSWLLLLRIPSNQNRIHHFHFLDPDSKLFLLFPLRGLVGLKFFSQLASPCLFQVRASSQSFAVYGAAMKDLTQEDLSFVIAASLFPGWQFWNSMPSVADAKGHIVVNAHVTMRRYDDDAKTRQDAKSRQDRKTRQDAKTRRRDDVVVVVVVVVAHVHFALHAK